MKAKMVGMAEDYSYSSAGYYVKGRSDLLVTENLYYAGMGKTPGEHQKNYEKFVRMDEPYAELITDQLLKY
ncbi:MAG: hypothetical protein Q8Q33_06605 [Chlamydiota bacterium]|nr:hypothetical protein [Chlamydiota bacterium]